MLLFTKLLIIGVVLQTGAVSFSEINALESKSVLRFDEFLKAEKIMIETLHDYIVTSQEKINVIKRKSRLIKHIHKNADGNIDAYLNNPLNILTILNRFVADWPEMEEIARNIYNTANRLQSLNHIQLPSKTDYENALGNILHLQNDNDVDNIAVLFDFGSSKFSWSDCLEIGQKSNEKGEYKRAKFWIETALERLQATTNQTTNNEYVKSKSRILETLLNTEYRADRLKNALNIAQQLSEIHPKSKNLQKAISNIERKMAKKNRVNPSKKSKLQPKFRDDHELCSASIKWDSYSVSDSQPCQLMSHLPHLILKPLRIELLSKDPHIILQHDVLFPQSINRLYQPDNFKLPLFAQNNILDITGYQTKKLSPWLVRRYAPSENTPFNEHNDTKIVGHLIFGMRAAKQGGSIIFPQLQKSVHLAKNTMLYFSNLNKFGEVDRRSRYHVCPVNLGEQINAQSALMNF